MARSEVLTGMNQRGRARPSSIAMAMAMALISIAGSAACDPLIGDDCTTSIDCSEDGDRICDTTMPGGYCTISDCEGGTCPSEGVCVQFYDGAHARSFCMRQCDVEKDCRDRYDCIEPEEGVATILDETFFLKGYCSPHEQ